jgi:hypothetical protein
MPMARMEPAEAVLHFRKWLTEETTVACVGTLAGLSFNMTGKVTDASAAGVEFSAKDRRCNLTLLPLFNDMRFVFCDPNDLPGAIRNPMLPNSAVGVSLPGRATHAGEEEIRDKLIFVALADEPG